MLCWKMGCFDKNQSTAKFKNSLISQKMVVQCVTIAGVGRKTKSLVKF